jgi:hypothetical protein
LGVVSCREALLDDFDFTDFLPEVRSNTGISISDNASWGAKMTFNMFKKQFSKISSSHVISGGYK